MHVIQGHPEIVPFIDAVLDTVREPDVITRDQMPGRWRYWQATVGPTRWLFVVVDWRGQTPVIVTAYGRRKVRL